MTKSDISDKNTRIMNMVVILVWLVVFMVMVLGILFPVVFFISLKSVYVKSQSITAELSAKYIEEFLAEKEAIIAVSAENEWIRDTRFFSAASPEFRGVSEATAPVLRRYLDDVLAHYPSFRFFAVLTPDKAKPVLLQPYEAQTALTLEQYERGYLYREWAQQTLARYRSWNREGSVPGYISNAFLSQPGNIPAVSISVAIVNDKKEMTGILYANISLNALSAFIKSMSYGRTGKVYVIDTVGNLLAHPTISPGIESKDLAGKSAWSLRDYSSNLVVSNSRESECVSGFYTLPEDGRIVLTTYKKIPSLGWTVVVEQDAMEAFSIVRIYSYVIIILVFLTIGGSILSFVLISRETAETTRQHRELVIISETDPLTGLLNRRSMLSRMDQFLSDYEQNGRSFAIALFDIDDFKLVNDSYGHVFGDVVLREIAARTVSVLRVEDLLFRWGGEEFLLVIRNCDLVRARGVAEKIRRIVSDTPINDGVTSVSLTVTIGVCQYRGGSVDSIIIHADEALYEGKRGGKNTVVVCND